MSQEDKDPKGILRELRRRSNDQIRVRNLLDEDYHVKWDTDKIFTVPGKKKSLGEGMGEAVLPRYIAVKFMEEVTTLLINADNVKHMKKYEKQYKNNPNVHWPDIEKRHALRTDDEKLVKEYMEQMFVKIEREFGRSVVPSVPEAKPVDTRPLTDRIMSELESQASTGDEAELTSKEKLVKDIT